MGGQCGGVGQNMGLQEEVEVAEVGEMEPGISDEILAEHQQCPYLVRAHALADGVQLGVGVFGFENEFGTCRVRVAVGGHEQGVRIRETRDERDIARADFSGQRADEEEFLIGHAAGCDDGDLFRGEGLEFGGGRFERVLPANGTVLGSVLCQWFGEAALAVDVVEIQAV